MCVGRAYLFEFGLRLRHGLRWEMGRSWGCESEDGGIEISGDESFHADRGGKAVMGQGRCSQLNCEDKFAALEIRRVHIAKRR